MRSPPDSSCSASARVKADRLWIWRSQRAHSRTAAVPRIDSHATAHGFGTSKASSNVRFFIVHTNDPLRG
jgi:hypothetical protein